MCKASAVGNATGPSCGKVGGAKTAACVDGAGTMDDDRPGGVEGEVDIVAREKQTDADSEIYYAMHPSKNKTPMMPDKTNKTPTLISS